MEKNYVVPQVDVIEIEVEKGFSASPGGGNVDIGGEGTWD